MASSFWDERYGVDEYAYGVEPNDFLRAEAHRIPPNGRVLCLAEGEGRNAVFLAARGHAVTAVDQSMKGLEKARKLAASRGVELELIEADLATFDLGTAKYSGVVSIFGHTPPAVRRRVFGALKDALVPGGVFIAEHYRPEQLKYGTGGPRDAALLAGLEALREELAGLELVVGREVERAVVEGSHHTGLAATVQIVAARPL